MFDPRAFDVGGHCARWGGAVLAMLCLATSVHAAQVTLAWDPNTEPGVAGYRLHYGTVGAGFGVVTNTGNVTSYIVGDLQPNQAYAFYVTCYNSSGLESEPSNVVEYTVPEIGDGGPTVSMLAVTSGGLQMRWTAVPGTTYRVLYKSEITDTAWQVLDEFVALDQSGYFVDGGWKAASRRFYRLEVVP